MKITLRLDDQLLADAKKLAIESGRTFTQVVEDALRLALSSRNSMRSRVNTKLHTCGGKRLQPGVDLGDNAALTDLIDDFDGSTGR